MIEKSKYFIVNEDGEVLVLLCPRGKRTLILLPEYGSNVSEENKLMEYLFEVIESDKFVKIDEIKKTVKELKCLNNKLIKKDVPYTKRYYLLYEQFDDRMIREINQILNEVGYEPHFVSLEHLESLILMNYLSGEYVISDVYQQVKKLELIKILEGDV